MQIDQFRITSLRTRRFLLPILSLAIGNCYTIRASAQSYISNTGSEASVTEVDVPFGEFSKEEIAKMESVRPDSSLSSKTLPVAFDGIHENDILTIVIDFKDATQGLTSDVFGNEIGELDVADFGFAAGDFNTLTQAIMEEVDDDFFAELAGTVANQNNEDLRIDFLIGDIGTAPVGVSEYYFVQVGEGLAGPHTGALGVAAGRSVRDSSGIGPNNGIQIGDVVASVFTDNIQGLGNLRPSDALTSGNLIFSRNSIVGTLSHEIGHVLSLSHINFSQSVQPTPSSAPIMGTGGIDLPNQQRITDREFSLTGFNAQNGNSQQFQIAQLVGAIGLHNTSFIGPLEIDSLTILAGTANNGAPSDLDVVDNDILSILFSPQDSTPGFAIAFDTFSTSPDLQPASLSITTTSHANTPNIRQTVELFNVASGVFEEVGNVDLLLIDSTTNFAVPGDVTRFINQVDGQIQTRFSYSATGPVLFSPWLVEIDQAIVILNQ